MINVATSPAYTCEKLVEIETEIDGYKRSGIKKLQDKQVDLTRWISITLYNTFYPVSDDDLHTIR
jgi:hypothetical protein